MNTTAPAPAATDDPLAAAILDTLIHRVGKDAQAARAHDWLAATILTVRDDIIDRWMASTREAHAAGAKRVYYLSLEFLIGRLLRDAIANLGRTPEVTAALASLGVDLAEIEEIEPDAALGNGGLGRLAACFMESLATLDLPAYGYGIRYVNGMFRQRIDDGWQVELPETWLAHGNPWEFERRESAYFVGFGGDVTANDAGQVHWSPAEAVEAVAVDTPVVGWRGKRVNTLRLWTAVAFDPIRLDQFNAGDHEGALAGQVRAESLVRVLYPADSTASGQELRLRQEYFFSSASIQDIVRRHVQYFGDIRTLPEKAAIQLNDTHPAVAVAELMRLLVDHHEVVFNEAWEITKATFGYTNHTLLPEALESWPLPLFERLLPRHMQIVYAINAKLLREARKVAGMDDRAIAAISLIDEGGERRVRMANLAFAGSHSVNGVAALHTDLMKQTVFADLHRLYPTKINNKTNGITPRRWLFECNPGLTALVRECIGDAFLDDAAALSAFADHAGDAQVQERFAAVKRANKVALVDHLKGVMGLRLDPDALFDVQIKRIHEYKRQLLNILETVALYDQIRSHPERDWQPRVRLFAGKAASSYHNAKLIIKLANDVARRVNSDPSVGGLLKVAFVPNYNVSLAEKIIPAADLSEQISTAGMEASGTGNMKFALNGALTIGTLDGANIEIRDHVGADNIVIFGLTAEEVAAKRGDGYNPGSVIEASRELAQAVNAVASGVFSPDDPNRYKDLMNGLYDHDWFMVAADFDAYAAAQRRVDGWWADQPAWRAAAVRNVAGVGWFSSDRTIREYAEQIWGGHVKPPIAALKALLEGRHDDPFSLLGMHAGPKGTLIRAFVPGAETLLAHALDGRLLVPIDRVDERGLFEGTFGDLPLQPLRYFAKGGGAEWWVTDPYTFGPVLGPIDDVLMGEGTHFRLYDKLGAHLIEHEGVEGVHFAVWAPNARRVSVVGDWNDWDGRRHPMRKRGDTGVWEIFLPELGAGRAYKYEIVGADGIVQPLKADPFAFASELRPATASLTTGGPTHEWGDADHREAWSKVDPRRVPISIYEVHAGSWQRDDNGWFLTWDALADRLIPYAVEMGFTHIEFLPISEHPYDPSWGYQTTGLYAPSARFGDVEGFARFVDGAHRAGLGVLLDWVPAHFPTDAHGLARFDGTALYEHDDPRLGYHPDWNTAIYNFGRREVASFLVNNALFWAERYHIDGLRVDAVASMLYRDYSRKAGEWIPNKEGGRENWEAVEFLRQTNKAVYGQHPGVFTVAEESTAWPGVSKPVHEDGLGFGFKWNMGFMHDTLKYMAREPVHRHHHHDDITFGLMYAFTENFVLPLSHDEVVHGKGSLLTKMSGDDWQQFANLRAYYAMMWGYPGKKLLFMGQEFAQRREWSEERALDWSLQHSAAHEGVRKLVRDLNRLYRAKPALHARDCEGEGFEWLVVDDAANSVFAWLRKAPDARPVAVICNMTPVARAPYRVPLPHDGRWREVINSDAHDYWGSGLGNLGGVDAKDGAAWVTLPPLATLMLEYCG